MRPILTRSPRRGLATVAVLAAMVASATACGPDEGSDAGSSSEPKTIDVTFANGTVTPNGDRVEVGVGQEVVLHVTADEAGEIHVHSNPEQELKYPAGESDQSITIDQPGVIEVESHSLDKVIVQLEVS